MNDLKKTHSTWIRKNKNKTALKQELEKEGISYSWERGGQGHRNRFLIDDAYIEKVKNIISDIKVDNARRPIIQNMKEIYEDFTGLDCPAHVLKKIEKWANTAVSGVNKNGWRYSRMKLINLSLFKHLLSLQNKKNNSPKTGD